MVASILHLGNVGFSEDDGEAQIHDNTPVEMVGQVSRQARSFIGWMLDRGQAEYSVCAGET